MGILAFVLFVLLWPLPACVWVSAGVDLHKGLSVDWGRALLTGVIAEALWIIPKFRAVKALITKQGADVGQDSNGDA